MKPKTFNRRQLLKNGARAAAGLLLASNALHNAAKATEPKAKPFQLPRPQLLKDDRISLVSTTETSAWQSSPVYKPAFDWDMLNLNVDPADALPNSKQIEGFGSCFNDLGWTSLSALDEQDRESVLKELYDPQAGARLNLCRMPIGPNDYATEAYSYDETDGDFELKHFSIEHDKHTLIPFIHAAQRYQPKLRLWASPWTPPSWMKRNHFYAEAPGFPQMGMKDNGIRPDQVGREGEDMFIQEARYFDAYARYFGRFIDAYQAEGIPIGMVMPQNEFNSAQNFPSCTWTPDGLVRFIHALGPEMQARNVDVFMGTVERGNPKLVEAVLADKDAARFIKGIGLQWAGKNALPALHREYPQLTIYQSEQECGNAANDWNYTSYCWELMKHYFRNGASAYMYWNTATDLSGQSTWGWPQNSLVSVDTKAKTYRFNSDYYLLKHLTHFVDVGARCLQTSGTCDDALAFANPDGTTVLVLRNERAHTQLVQVQVAGRAVVVELEPDSIATLTLKPAV